LINTIIKRDGSSVKFQPEKLNKLCDWAVNHNVDWSTIALNGIKKLSDGCTVQDLIKALISACLDQETEAHLKVARKTLCKRFIQKSVRWREGNSLGRSLAENARFRILCSI